MQIKNPGIHLPNPSWSFTLFLLLNSSSNLFHSFNPPSPLIPIVIVQHDALHAPLFPTRQVTTTKVVRTQVGERKKENHT